VPAAKTKVTNVSPSHFKGFDVQYFVGQDDGRKVLKVLLTAVDEPQRSRMQAMGKPYLLVVEEIHPNTALAFAAGNEEAVEPHIARCLWTALQEAYKAGVLDRA
jgi:hypothetical protein